MKLLILLFIIWLLYPVDNQDTQTVFSENIDSYRIYEVYFDKGEENTDTLEKYVNRMQVLTIYPYVNPLYANKLTDLESYSFKNKVNLDEFEKYYIQQLEKNGYKQEMLKYKFSGIPVKKMHVYTSENILRQLNLNFKPLT